MMPGESEDALNGPNPIVPWIPPMEIKERFAALHFDSNIPRQIDGWLGEWLALVLVLVELCTKLIKD